MSNVEEYTKNFKFIIPEFNVATWHTEIKENFKAIDALIANFVQSQQYKGAWKQVTQYEIGDLVYISDENSNNYGGLFKVLVNHITTGDDFDTFLGNNPTYYNLQGEMGAQVAALRAQDWAEKTDGIVTINESPVDYSSKAYAIGGTGTETNNSKYFKEQAELARDGILLDPGFIAIKNDMLGDEYIKTVALNILNVNSVGDNILSILSVYNNLSDINVCSSNISAILDAPNQATNAQNSATSAAQSAQLAQEAALSITNFDLFDHKWSDHLLNDQNWLRADTFSWHPATTKYGTYLEAYNHLVADLGTIEEETWYAWVADTGTDEEIIIFTKSETVSVGDNVYNYDRDTIIGTVERYDTDSQKMYNTAFNYGFWRHAAEDIEQSDTTSSGAVRKTETIGSYTITYWLAIDGHKICLPDQESTANNIYNKSGVAWYYILDTTNQRFKLPRENPAREELIQTIRAKGNGKTIGLYNGTITGGFCSGGSVGQLQFFCSNIDDAGVGGIAISPGQVLIGVTPDSTKSGIISDVTESTSVYKGKKYLYFYVGQFSQSATEQTAGLNTELFNGKMDLDLGNATQVTKDTIVGWAMPDYSAAVDAGTGHTSYANAYVVPNTGFVSIRLTLSTTSGDILVNNVVVASGGFSGTGVLNIGSLIPVSKNDKIHVDNNYASMKFYPLKGISNA